MPLNPYQSSVSVNPSTAYVGQVDRSSGTYHVASRVVDEAAGLDAGRFVAQIADAQGDKVEAIDATGDVASLLAGVVLRKERGDSHGSSGTCDYEDEADCPVLRKGFVWVEPESAVTVGQVPYVIHGGIHAGRIRSDAGAGGTEALKAATATVASPVQVLEAGLLAAGRDALLSRARPLRFTTAGGTPAHAPANVVIVGTDEDGETIGETLALAQTATYADTTLSYATVTSLDYPAADGTSATVAVGIVDDAATIVPNGSARVVRTSGSLALIEVNLP